MDHSILPFHFPYDPLSIVGLLTSEEFGCYSEALTYTNALTRRDVERYAVEHLRSVLEWMQVKWMERLL